MHLLTAFKTGAMRAVPPSLPPGLFEAASRRAGVRTSSTGSRPDIPPVPAIPKQFSGPMPQRTQSPLNRPPIGPVPAQITGTDWLISPQEKAHFDTIFATVDKRRVGYLTGDDAVGFFANSQLPEDTLAQIWDLADIDSDGQLSKEEFAVAMYLVRQQRSTREPLPQVLPPALIPPSFRRQPVPPPPRPMQPQGTGARSAAEDLFGLDVFTAPIQTSQSTGGSAPLFQTPSSPTRPQTATTFKPFVPSSSFGQSLTPHATGLSNTAAQPRSPQYHSDDLLGDADPEESKKLTQETTELANLSNQVSTLSKEMGNIQAKRGNAEQDLATTNRQKRDFEARLAQARAMYEQEVKDFKALEEKLAASKAETRKLQQDFAMIEGSRQDLQNQFNQVSAALEADQRENASLKEKIRQANAQVSQLKPQVEKLRSEARQQKGLAAINKKQLATVEGERDRIQAENDSIKGETLEPERQTSPPPVMSPASSNSQRNPFFKRSPSASTENAFAPNPASSEGPHSSQNIFDNVFGPAFSIPSTATPPPPTTFRTETSSPQPQIGNAAKSSPTAGDPTPLESPPAMTFDHIPDTAVPPPPPRSRQITPSELPIVGHHEAESSSVKASPPASRLGKEPETEPVTQASSKDASQLEDSEGTQSGENRSLAPNESTSSIPGAFPEATSPPESAKKDFTFDELFAGRTHERSQSQKALDFEEAFAAMKKDPKKDSPFGGSNPGRDHSEFPPIRELENDDDDSSTASEGPTGFDDDFTPVSPPRNDTSRAIQPFPSNDATPLPGPDAQMSPPSYDQSEPQHLPGTVPPEFGGLLPGRTDPTAPGDAPHSVDHVTGAPIVDGIPQPTTASTPKPAADFEAAFEGLNLTPAKEVEDDDDDTDEDDFESPFNKDPSNFDMTFDSPTAPPRPSGFPPHTAGSASGNSTTNPDFFSFGAPSIRPQTSGSQPPFQQQQKSSSPPTQPSAHDWDALFSVLDEAKGQGAAGKSDANPATTAPPTSTEPSQASVPATASPATQAKPPGWALSTDPGEDDFILQRLTAMGYARDESLAALEKFDYNLDKVSCNTEKG